MGEHEDKRHVLGKAEIYFSLRGTVENLVTRWVPGKGITSITEMTGGKNSSFGQW